MTYPYHMRDVKHLSAARRRRWFLNALAFVLVLIGISDWMLW